MADAPLTVTVTHMRESNGNQWWSACLYRDTGKTMAFANGYEFYQSPIKGRVDYEADCMRKLLDPALPYVDILAYDTDAPATPSPPVAAPPATPVAPTERQALLVLIYKLFDASAKRCSTDKVDLQEWLQRAWHHDILPGLSQPQPLTGGAPIAYSLQWPGDVELGRINISTTFDTEKEAREYADGCLHAETIRVVALVTAPSTPAPPEVAP